MCLGDQLFALAFQLLKIIDLLPIHISPYFAQPCSTVVFKINNNFIHHQNEKSNFIGTCI